MSGAGRSVHYVRRIDGKLECYAALTIKEFPPPGGPNVANVLYFTPDDGIQVVQRNVPYDNDGGEGTWHNRQTSACFRVQKQNETPPEPVFRHMIIVEHGSSLTAACGKRWVSKGPSMTLGPIEDCQDCTAITGRWKA